MIIEERDLKKWDRVEIKYAEKMIADIVFVGGKGECSEEVYYMIAPTCFLKDHCFCLTEDEFEKFEIKYIGRTPLLSRIFRL